MFPSTVTDAARASRAELHTLCRGLGVDVRRDIVQVREHADTHTYLGKGKLAELIDGLADAPVDVVIVDEVLTPRQRRRLNRETGLEVLDRLDVILHTFEQRAVTPLARIEVEMARLRRDLPRVRDDTAKGDKEGGGGRGGRGHSNVELAKQAMRKRLAELCHERDRILELRPSTNDNGPRKVAFVGYTNAGKSTWVRALTGAEVGVADKLFATLRTTTRALHDVHPRTLAVDTVGFLQRLPHEVVGSFRATLREAESAALLVVVLDAAAPDLEFHLATIDETLRGLNLRHLHAPLVLLNQWDRTPSDLRARARETLPEAIPVCALDDDDVLRVRTLIRDRLADGDVEATWVVPWTAFGELARHREHLDVIEETSEATGVRVRVRGARAALEVAQAALEAASAESTST